MNILLIVIDSLIVSWIAYQLIKRQLEYKKIRARFNKICGVSK